MRIAVILRHAPDPLEELPLVEGRIAWDDVSPALDAFDDVALEEAVLLKEQTAAELVVIGLAAHGQRLLQTAVARGADRAVSLAPELPEETSSRALAPIIAAAVRRLAPDLVLTGIQAPGDLFGQLGPFLADDLGWPQVNGAVALEAGGERILVRHDIGAGRIVRLSLALPAVVGIQASRRPPGYVSGTNLKKAIQTTRIETLVVDSAPRPDKSRLSALHHPPKDRQVELFEGNAKVVAGKIVDLLTNLDLTGSRT